MAEQLDKVQTGANEANILWLHNFFKKLKSPANIQQDNTLLCVMAGLNHLHQVMLLKCSKLNYNFA